MCDAHSLIRDAEQRRLFQKLFLRGRDRTPNVAVPRLCNGAQPCTNSLHKRAARMGCNITDASQIART